MRETNAWGKDGPETRELLAELFTRLTEDAPGLFEPGSSRKSDFFRDIAGSQYSDTSRSVVEDSKISFEAMLNIYDRSIIDVENPHRHRRERGNVHERARS